MAAGTVVMNRVSQQSFLDEVTAKGKVMVERLLKLQSEVSIIGNIRGKGLMLGIEFVDPNGTMDSLGSLPPSGTLAAKIQKECFEHRLIMEKGGRYGSVMRCLCALNVSYEEIDIMLTTFEQAVRKVDADECC